MGHYRRLRLQIPENQPIGKTATVRHDQRSQGWGNFRGKVGDCRLYTLRLRTFFRKHTASIKGGSDEKITTPMQLVFWHLAVREFNLSGSSKGRMYR